YEKVFFNVLDRLGATSYLVNQVLGGNLDTSLREGQVGRILKLYGLSGGVGVFEAVLDYFRHPPVLPERPELLPMADLAGLRENLLVKAVVVARGLPPDAQVFRKLALLDEARAAIDRDGGEAAFSSLRSPSIQTLMRFFGEGVGSPTPSGNA